MSEPFLAEIRLFPFGYAPDGWAACDGQVLSIAQNEALFSLLGTTYGGDGRTNFALPDLRGRVPLHRGAAAGGTERALGEAGGEDAHQLTIAEIPRHAHTARANSHQGATGAPAGSVWAAAGQRHIYAAEPNTSMDDDAIAPAGADHAHSSMQPYLGMQFCISLMGIYPSRS